MLGKRRRGRHEATVELTPLIDVVFLLLIFFMVSTSFIRETQLQINLPESSGDLQELEPSTIEIVIDRQGAYAVNDRVLLDTERSTLVNALQTMVQEEASALVVITADAMTSHESVVRAMDAAGSVGLTRISITTQQLQTAQP